ncbi:hypothetical protein CLAFUW4_14124 [Fulvia fulva]|uniref:Uncharacterized protein n=1 Tax=Passalora fulva TaxID=5499 RepID=A0A9Q8PLF9_PASFU|nr:uncharacterized protein CLAFUR5_13958 [Fulvia fulva]KAK4610629.1 hypothetical protein CLAFUR4_14127 [Fulvia fulva]KAK4611144.1 hypothetical protein CLAFUR0_14131 [Fulvia fulva]UJO24559.1 hypothetical protein CLAFUR5_13958 [Fulvia fulva]WPV21949.1 hypothetical protein CLAFUW4_14124 [Fulvia fulva]WPV36680.1 hypothetical protein CLAFUW7_14135 [Fulvia fulva]
MAPRKIANDPFKKFWKSKFVKVEETTDSTLAYSALTNAVHPVFGPTQWTNLPVGGWDVVEQSCKLASLFFQSAALRPFWATLICYSDPETASDQKKQFSLAAFGGIDATQQAQIDEVLNEDLPTHLKFKIDEKTLIGAHCQENGTSMCCGYHTQAEGRNSNVFVAKSTYQALQKAQSPEATDIVELTWLRFHLAVNMVHEVAHALRNATDASEEEEPFFGDAIISEIGFELEKCLFGGPIMAIWADEDNKYSKHDGTKSNLMGLVVQFEWPYQQLVTEYDLEYRTMGKRRDPRDVRELDLAWRISITLFAKFFSDAFWQSVDQEDMEAFHPPHTCGYTFRVDDKAYFEPVCRADDEAPYLGMTHHRDADGVILPGQAAGPARPALSRRVFGGRITKPGKEGTRRSTRNKSA